jgi:hypothetical protein
MIAHLEPIAASYVKRSTYAHAELLSDLIKLFRSILRGVTVTKFFLFRLEKDLCLNPLLPEISAILDLSSSSQQTYQCKGHYYLLNDSTTYCQYL